MSKKLRWIVVLLLAIMLLPFGIKARASGTASEDNPGKVTLKLVAGEGHHFEEYDSYTDLTYTLDVVTYEVDPSEGISVGMLPDEINDIHEYVSGWYEDAELNEKINTKNDIYYPDKDTTLYPEWKSAYKVIYDYGFAEDAGYLPTEVYAKQNYFVPRYMNLRGEEYNGKVFAGWYTDENFSKDSYVADFGSYPIRDNNTVFYAKWVDPTKVTFDAGENGHFFSGERYEDEFQAPGSMLGVYKAAYYEASTTNPQAHLGWSLTKGGEIIDLRNNIIVGEEPITLYAVYGDGYNVTFYPNSEDGYFDEYSEASNDDWIKRVINAPSYTLTFPKGVSIGQYQLFDNYNLKESRRSTRYVDGYSTDGSRENMVDLDSYVPEDINSDLYAIYEDTAIKYLVTYHANGGYFTNAKPGTESKGMWVSTEEGAYISPVFVVYPNYTKALLGWSKKKDGKNIDVGYDEYCFPETDTNLYAVWGDGYKITYNVNNSDGYFKTAGGKEKSYSIMVPKGKPIGDPYYEAVLESADKITLYGYEDENGEAVDSDYIPTGDMELYGVWKNRYQITYHAEGGYFINGEGEKTETIVETRRESDDVFLGATPYTDEDKEFLGWSLTKNGTITDRIKLDQNKDVYAIWTDDVIHITFDGNGGKINLDEWVYDPEDMFDNETITVAKGKTIELPDDVCSLKKGFLFDGWKDKDGNKITDDSFVATEDTTFYVDWAEAYKVTFYSNGGEINGDEDQVEWNIKKGELVIAPECSREGMAFVGWFDNSLGTGDSVDFSQPILKDKEFYAIWTDDFYVVKLNAGDGYFGYGNDSHHEYTFNVAKGNTINLPISSEQNIWKDDYYFVGWYSDESFEDLICANDYQDKEEFEYEPESSMTIYAKFVKGYSVKFDGNAGWVRNNCNKTYTISVRPGFPIGYQVYGYSKEKNEESTGSFIGWFKEPECRNIVATIDTIAKYVPYDGEVLYAGFEATSVAVTGVDVLTKVSVGIGDFYALAPVIIPANAENRKVSFESADKSIATVSEEGYIRGVSQGDTVITVTTDDGHYKATCTVTVVTPTATAVRSIENTIAVLNSMTDRDEMQRAVNGLLHSLGTAEIMVSRLNSNEEFLDRFLKLEKTYMDKAHIRVFNNGLKKTPATKNADIGISVKQVQGAALSAAPDHDIELVLKPASNKKKIDSIYTKDIQLDMSLENAETGLAPIDSIDDLKAPLIITTSLPNSFTKTKLFVLQLDGNDYELIEFEVFNDTLQFTVSSLAPIAIVELANGTPKDDNNENSGQPVDPVIQPSSATTGTSAKMDSGTYVVTGAYEVSFKAPANKKVKKLSILSTVTIDGQTYKVTSIEAGAFKGCKKLTSVTIPDSVTNIGKNAFSGCSKLGKITVNGNTLKKAAKGAFKGTKKGATVTVYAKDKKTFNKVVKMLKSAGLKSAKFKFKKKSKY